MSRTFHVALFDFDGVILESAAIKVQGFVDCLGSEPPSALDAIRRYATQHGGVSRFDKFRHIYDRILQRPLSHARLDELCAEYSERVLERVAEAPFLPGVIALLDAIHAGTICYVVSGTPQDELRQLVERRGLSRYFRDVVGSPAPKAELTRGIVAQHDAASAVLIGDSITDYDAAQQAGIAFLGVASGDGATLPSHVETVSDLMAYRHRFFPATELT